MYSHTSIYISVSGISEKYWKNQKPNFSMDKQKILHGKKPCIIRSCREVGTLEIVPLTPLIPRHYCHIKGGPRT